MAESVIERYCEELMNEQPKIDAAIKNFISILISTNQMNENQNAKENFSFIEKVMAIVKLLSKTINAVELIEENPWRELHPQTENEDGITQIEKIVKYKSLFFLTNKIKTQNLKITKSFGKLFFEFSDTWKEIHQKLLEMRPETIDQQFYEDALLQFQRSLTSTTEEEEQQQQQLPVKLIWCSDLDGELLKRQALRVQQAKEREVNYQQQLSEEIERLRTNITTQQQQTQQEEEEEERDSDEIDEESRVEYLS